MKKQYYLFRIVITVLFLFAFLEAAIAYTVVSQGLNCSAYTASSSYEGYTPDLAFDGNMNNSWNAGTLPVSWIEVNLGKPIAIAQISLIVSQSPSPAFTNHEVWVSSSSIECNTSTATLAHTFTGETYNNQLLAVRFDKPITAQYVQIKTTTSPSWVAWNEIQIMTDNPVSRTGTEKQNSINKRSHDTSSQTAGLNSIIQQPKSSEATHPACTVNEKSIDSINRELIKAIDENNQEKVIQLIQAGADVNYKNNLDNGKTPLMTASIKGSSSIIDILLRHRADLEATIWDGTTALGFALKACDLNTVEILKKHGAKIQYNTKRTNQALFDALSKNCAPVIKNLIQNNININEKNFNDETPLVNAIMNSYYIRNYDQTVLEMILNAGADPNITRHGELPLNIYLNQYNISKCVDHHIIELFIKNGAKLNDKDIRTRTPLMLAAQHWDIETINIILKAGAKVDISDGNGETALFYSIFNNQAAATQILLQHGADPNIKATNGVTPIVYAYANRKTEHVNLLKKYGADISQMERSYFCGRWIGIDEKGYNVELNMDINGQFMSNQVKDKDRIWYRGTWEYRGGLLLFHVVKAASFENEQYYLIEHPFDRKATIEKTSEDEMNFILPHDKRILILKNAEHSHKPSITDFFSSRSRH